MSSSPERSRGMPSSGSCSWTEQIGRDGARSAPAPRKGAIRRLQAEQRPRFAVSDSLAPVGAAPGTRLEARAALMDELSASSGADARRRVRRGALDGPILGVECEPFPRTLTGVGAERDLSRRSGRYACLAATARFKAGESSIGGALGHPYRAKVDFQTGRYAFCKISGRPGPTADPRVTTRAPAAGDRGAASERTPARRRPARVPYGG